MKSGIWDAVIPAGLDFDPVNDPARRRHLVLALPWGSTVDPRHVDSGGHVLERGDVLVDRDLARQGFVNVDHRPGNVGNVADAVEDERGIWAVVDLTEDGERVLSEGNGDVSAEIIMPGLRWYFTGVAIVSKDETPAIPGSRVVFSNKQYRAFAVVARPPNTEEVKPMPEAAAQAKPTPAAEAAQTFDFEGYLTGAVDRMAEAHTQLSTSLAESLGDSFSAAMKAALEDLPNPQGANGPQPVRAARYTITREAPVYSMDGRGFSLVRDGWYSVRHRDAEATERIRRFSLQTDELAKYSRSVMSFAGGNRAQFTTSSTSTASQIIPPGYRPDLFVPMLAQGRPMVQAISPGTIENGTPFVVPIFNTFTGATGTHVEGTNPTDGTLSFTTKTVTPTTIDGKLLLTRELADSSNPAIDQIALQAMRESYARQTEALVYTLLNGANGAGGVITAGLVPSGSQAATFASTGGSPFPEAALIKGIRQQLARYPFARFMSPEIGLMGQNATVLIAGTSDSTGRPLFPSINPYNAMGQGNTRTQGWEIDTVPFIPAWAMTGTAAGDSQIMVLNSLDAWAWESPTLLFQFLEKQGPALIEMALFGYFATHLLRPVGLSGVRIT